MCNTSSIIFILLDILAFLHFAQCLDTSVFQAVCCDDHIHCCPHDTVCNLQEQTCDSQAGGRPPLRWLEKVSAFPSAKRGEQCDRQTSCPGDSTCCKTASGQWACCPLPQVSAGEVSGRRWLSSGFVLIHLLKMI